MNNNDSRDSYYPLDFSGEGSVNVNVTANNRDNNVSLLQLLSVKEAGKLLGIGEWSMYQLLRKNAIRSVKVGGRRLISLRAIDTYITSREERSNINGNYY
jgi:excisionase family DNA binding protein